MSNLRVLPEQDERVETGPVQFGNDWPGLFIRGDNAMYFAGCLDFVLHNGINASAIYTAVLRGLLSDLRGCDARDLMLSSPAAPDAHQGTEPSAARKENKSK